MVPVLIQNVRFCCGTRLENGVHRNGKQPGSAENSFFDHSKMEAMKSLSVWEAAHSDDDQFRAEPFSSYRCLTSGLNKERITKIAL